MDVYMHCLCRVEAHIATELRTFDQQLGVQTAGEDDDDIVMEGGSILVNDKCPITLTPVSEKNTGGNIKQDK
jgi:hypothetical protein